MTGTSVRALAPVPTDVKKMLAFSLPLDRSTVLELVATVLNPPRPDSELRPEDCLQIGQLLAGHAGVVADDVRDLLNRTPGVSRMRPLTETVLAEAHGRLSVPPRATLASAQNRARLVRVLYERYDRLMSATLG